MSYLSKERRRAVIKTKYIVVIVKDFNSVQDPIIVDNVKVEYVSVGQQFHEKQFKGQRPTHVINRTYLPALEVSYGKQRVKEWFDYIESQTRGAIWNDRMGGRLNFGDDPYSRYNEFGRKDLSQIKHRLNSIEERILKTESNGALLDRKIEELRKDLRDNSLDIEDIFKELREINARNF